MIEKWRERQEDDESRRKGGTVDDRLIYYADLYDLRNILEDHWHGGEFSDALGGNLNNIRVLLKQLEHLRNPVAHRRELHPHEKHLAVGIAGEIRNRIVQYRSQMETNEGYYPRIESVKDNLGNTWSASLGSNSVSTEDCLRVGDELELVVAATDPEGDELLYYAELSHRSDREEGWGNDNVLTIKVGEEDVGKVFDVHIKIRSQRSYHAHAGYDDRVAFRYEVLPPEQDE